MKKICLIGSFALLCIVVSAQDPSLKSIQTDAQKQMAEIADHGAQPQSGDGDNHVAEVCRGADDASKPSPGTVRPHLHDEGDA